MPGYMRANPRPEADRKRIAKASRRRTCAGASGAFAERRQVAGFVVRSAVDAAAKEDADPLEGQCADGGVVGGALPNRPFGLAAERSIVGPTPMTRDEATQYATWWTGSWNNRDIEAVLATFDEEVEFTSPRAVATVGLSTVRGRQALRSYWEAALAGITSLRFVLERSLWDPEAGELAIIYRSEINGEAKLVSENLRFGRNGKVIAAEVFHGVARPSNPTGLRRAG
jgi:hypothetical protein